MINEGVGKITCQSSIYETEPWGFDSKRQFLNQVILIESDLKPHEVLSRSLKIEKSLGRQRTNGDGYHSRSIDIDILMFDNLTLRDDNLEIPHPRLHERNFTLVPMAEIAGDWIHPGLDKSISQLAENSIDTGVVKRYRPE